VNDNSRTTRNGWTVGGGIEYAVTDNWSVRAEYRYSNFGFFYDGQVVYLGIFQGHRWTENQVKAGFSYKFVSSAPPAVVAKY
jgi:outer membrane immunogenic protein